MADRIESEIKMRGTLFESATCPHCGTALDDDGLRMRIVVSGVASLDPEFGPDGEFLGFELGYSYDADDKREEYVCYNCDNVVIKIVKE